MQEKLLKKQILYIVQFRQSHILKTETWNDV